MFVSDNTAEEIRRLAIYSVVAFHNCCDKLRKKYGEITPDHVHIVSETKSGGYYLLTDIPCYGILYEFSCDKLGCVGHIQAYKKFDLLDKVEGNNESDPQHENRVLSGL